MMEVMVQKSLFEPAQSPNRNAHLVVSKQNGKYHIIISAVFPNQHILELAVIPPNIK